MKVKEFKKVLKPLIKECIKEVILEEGVLSNVVSEVAKGLQGNLVTENNSRTASLQDMKEKEAALEKQKQERIKRLNESAKFQDLNIFEGTKEIVETTQGSPLQGVTSEDPGIDISGIVGLAGNKWKHLI